MDIRRELRGIDSEPDLASKALKMAMLMASLFREIGYGIVVHVAQPSSFARPANRKLANRVPHSPTIGKLTARSSASSTRRGCPSMDLLFA